MSLNRALRNFGKATLRRAFEIGQRCGVDILPRHFYSSIPDLRQLRQSRQWRQPRSLFGVPGADPDSQLAFAKSCCTPQLTSRVSLGDIYEAACRDNGAVGYGPVEAMFLFCFIHSHRPQKIVQVGAGVSTAVILMASAEAGYSPELVCIDPFPTGFLQRAASEQRLRLVSERAQDVDLSTLTDLGDHGLLFIDSTHTVKPDGDVNRLVLEVLPRLGLGAFVHFHDIYFPYDYPPDLFHTNFFWAESTLLHAFLIHNSRCALRASLSLLHHTCPNELQSMLPGYRPAPTDNGLLAKAAPGHFPSAAYLQVTG